MNVDRTRRTHIQAASATAGVADGYRAATVGRSIDHNEAGATSASRSLDGDIGAIVECGVDLRVTNI